MEFKDKYTNSVEKDMKKIEISLESYAICEMLDTLIKRLGIIAGRFK